MDLRQTIKRSALERLANKKFEQEVGKELAEELENILGNRKEARNWYYTTRSDLFNNEYTAHEAVDQGIITLDELYRRVQNKGNALEYEVEGDQRDPR